MDLVELPSYWEGPYEQEMSSYNFWVGNSSSVSTWNSLLSEPYYSLLFITRYSCTVCVLIAWVSPRMTPLGNLCLGMVFMEVWMGRGEH